MQTHPMVRNLSNGLVSNSHCHKGSALRFDLLALFGHQFEDGVLWKDWSSLIEFETIPSKSLEDS